jgi:hypothetical protein
MRYGLNTASICVFGRMFVRGEMVTRRLGVPDRFGEVATEEYPFNKHGFGIDHMVADAIGQGLHGNPAEEAEISPSTTALANCLFIRLSFRPFHGRSVRATILSMIGSPLFGRLPRAAAVKNLCIPYVVIA